MLAARKFTSDMLWSFTGNLVSVAAGLVTIKVITAWVEAEHYGSASLLFGAVALLNGVLIGPLMNVHLRLHFDYEAEGRGAWYAEAFRALLHLAMAAIITIYVLFAAINAWLGSGLYLDYVFSVAALLVGQSYFAALSCHFEVRRCQRQLAALNIAHRALQPLFLVALVWLSVSDVDAILLSQALSVCALAVVFFSNARSLFSRGQALRSDGDWRALLRPVASIGWSIPFSFAAMWLVTTSDRYILQYLTSNVDVGKYAMNYGLWSMPFLFLNGWLEILSRPLLFAAAADANWAKVQAIVFRRLSFGAAASALGTVMLYFLSRPISDILLGANYWVHIELVMTIAVAHCFFVVGYSIVPIFWAAKRLNMVLVATIVAGMLNVTINFITIPEHGMLGAAFASLVSYLLWASMLAVFANKLVITLPRKVEPIR